MQRAKNYLLAPLIASIFMFFAYLVVAQNYEAKPLPDIEFADMDGKKVKLSDYRGKVVLLNFWASWCAPCIKEMPELDELQAEHGKDNFKVIALSEDGTSPDVQAFYQKHNISHLEIFHDTGSKVFFDLGLKGLPYSIVIDKQGNEATRIEGFIDWSSGVKLIIDNLLKQ